ncbi:MAG: hypothetical protein RLN75_02755, partial [Longimicrobiales bacterium]
MLARTGARPVPLLLFALFAAACAADGGTPQPDTGAAEDEPARNRGQAFIEDSSEDPNILGIALGSDDHTTLAAAVEA